MKRMFGVALLALPLAVGSVHASGWPFNVQAGGTFYMRGGNGLMPQAGPWYLYWPLEAHFVAPAPTGYPYWPPPQVSPKLPAPAIPQPVFGVPNAIVAPPPAAAAKSAPVARPPAAAAAPAPVALPPVRTAPAPANPAPQAAPSASPQLQLPPYLQPTSYYPTVPCGQPPSYWYDR